MWTKFYLFEIFFFCGKFIVKMLHLPYKNRWNCFFFLRCLSLQTLTIKQFDLIFVSIRFYIFFQMKFFVPLLLVLGSSMGEMMPKSSSSSMPAQARESTQHVTSTSWDTPSYTSTYYQGNLCFTRLTTKSNSQFFTIIELMAWTNNDYY